MKTCFLWCLILIFASSCGTDSPMEGPLVPPVLQSISVKSSPQKTTYAQDEALDLTGLEVVGTYSDDSVRPIQVTAANVSGFSTETPADQRTVVITVEGKTTSFNIKVLAPSVALLESISVKTLPNKVVYTLGEELVLVGMEIEGQYTDGQARMVAFTTGNISGYSADAPAAEQRIVVTVEDKTASFVVKVLPLQVSQGVLTKVVDGTAEIVLPAGITSIGFAAFENLKSVKKVILNEGLESISADAFISSNVEEVVFPSSLKTVGNYAFYNCPLLKVVDLSNTKLTIINDNAFSRGGLTQLKLPPTLVEIADQAFIATPGLASLEVPQGVRSIGQEAFRESGLSALKLPNSVSFIDARAFYQCFNLTEVLTYGTVAESLPASVMGDNCFAGAGALTTFEIPQSIKKIGQGILGTNTKVTALTIPAGVTHIAFSAFNHTSIRSVVVHAVVPSAVRFSSSGYWYGFPETVETITVPAGSADAYKAATGWSEFSAEIQ